jgi:probable F420-dependent oxidoreductase
MRFGLSLPHYGFSLPGGAPITFDEMATWALRAESLGFDSLWVSDHFFYSFARFGDDPTPIASVEPLTAIAGLAAVTERIRLGTLVLGSPFRHPSILAKMATTIDGISGGRLDLGLGAGWFEEEFGAFGYPFGSVDDRFRSLEETLQVVDALFSGASTSFEGPTVSLRDALLLPEPVQRRIPTWIGGKGGPRLLTLAARYADGWNSVWRWTPEAYGERASFARSACEREGRDPATFRFSVGLYSLIAGSEETFRQVFDRGKEAMPGGAMRDETEVSWRSDTLSGTADQVIERVEAFEAVGVEEIVVAPWVLPFAVPEPEQVELFAEHVLGRFRAGPADVVNSAVDALDAAVAVLEAAVEPLHWTVIQDRALRAGRLDPFTPPDVRRELLSALRRGLSEGKLRSAGKGMYELSPPLEP